MFKPTREQRLDFSSVNGPWAFKEALSNIRRKYFIQGQADYRAGFAMPDAVRSNVTASESWNMGWQCDAEVERRGLKLSDLGLIVPKPELAKDFYYEEADSVSDVQGAGRSLDTEG